jgi:hypothetical protein
MTRNETRTLRLFTALSFGLLIAGLTPALLYYYRTTPGYLKFTDLVAGLILIIGGAWGLLWGWLTWRAMRFRRRATKWTAGLLASLACLLPLAIVVCTLIRAAHPEWENADRVAAAAANRAKARDVLAAWRPPPKDAPDDVVFPERVGAFTRVAVDGRADIPELDLTLSGRHAQYRIEPEVTLDVFLYHESAAEGVATRVEQKLPAFRDEEDADSAYFFGVHRHLSVTERGYFMRAELKSWVMVARSPRPVEFRRGEELRFVHLYLETTGGK